MYLILAILAQLADVITTALFLSLGLTELNPLFGSDPEIWRIIAMKVVVIAAIALLCQGRGRRWLLCSAAVLGFGAAGWNMYVLQYSRMI